MTFYAAKNALEPMGEKWMGEKQEKPKCRL